MSEQQSHTITTRRQAATTSACPHPEAIGKRWGDPISEERQAELQGYLDKWAAEKDHSERKGPFVGIRLSGADVSWLAEQSSGSGFSGAGLNLHLEGARLREAHLEQADLSYANLEGADLSEAHLEGARLIKAHLARANLGIAYLAGANLSQAHLKGTDLSIAQLEGAALIEANLGGADLSYANLEGTTLREAQLTRADLSNANLARANLSSALLARANFTSAQLESADLRRSSFDKASRLNEAVFTGASFDQITFDNTNLTVVDWSLVTTLGDECTARARKSADGKPKARNQRLDEYKAAVRANRVLAVNLQAQGLAEDASRFAYQAQVLQRQVLRYQRKPGAYLFSLLLAVLAGYGYRLRHIIVAYALIVLVFAAAFLAADALSGHAPLTVQHAFDSLQISLNAVHGRVFFAQFHLDTIQSWIATGESIVGIVIEGVFVAMLIQRFFGR